MAQKTAASRPARIPKTTLSGPWAMAQPRSPSPCTARLMKIVYPVMATMSSKLAAATTVAGMAAIETGLTLRGRQVEEDHVSSDGHHVIKACRCNHCDCNGCNRSQTQNQPQPAASGLLDDAHEACTSLPTHVHRRFAFVNIAASMAAIQESCVVQASVGAALSTQQFPHLHPSKRLQKTLCILTVVEESSKRGAEGLKVDPRFGGGHGRQQSDCEG